MSIKLYNTLTRKKELLSPINKKEVGMYTCGPTVYNFAHIGNLRTYIFEDLLRRVLTHNGLKIKQVMNITDVGHLTSDADTGEDKIQKAAKKEKKTVWEIAEYYTQKFQEDLNKLNIISPDIWCKATDHISEQIELIIKLEKRGYVYQKGGNIYFDTSKLNDYGKLARLDLNVEQKNRVEKDSNKKNQSDFVLWFTNSKFSNQEMTWESPWGRGYPGWHLECSAMSIKYLGEQFDIHCGGMDHIPIHHTNEIAQSEAATGKKPWVRYWLHGAFLELSPGQKMAKSGDNFLTLTSLEEKGYPVLAYRYLCLGTHYRKPLIFSYEAMENAVNTYKKLVEKFRELNEEGEENKRSQKKYLNRFNSSVNNDLNLPQALAILWEVIKDEKLSNKDKKIIILDFDQILGLNLNGIKKEEIPEKIKKLAQLRDQARENKEWERADALRLQIKKEGYILEDTSTKTKIKKIN